MLTSARSFNGPACLMGMFLLTFTLTLQHRSFAIPIEPQVQQADEAATLGKVRALVRQLESDELAKRDEAETELIKLGQVALRLLPTITPQTSGELKIRLQRIRKELESETAESFFEPSKVNLQGTMKLNEVLAKIKEQTGNLVKLEGGDAAGNVDVTVDWKDTKFFEAIDDLIIERSLRLVAFASTESELVLAPANEAEMPSPDILGPFRLDVSGVESQRTFGTQLDGLTRVSMVFSWEPRLEPVFMKIPMSSVVAKIGDKEIRATNPNAAPEIRLNIGGSSAQVDLQLPRIDRETLELKSLSGEFVVSVPSEKYKYEFKKFGSGKKQTHRHGDVGVTLEGMQRNGKVYEMRLFVEFGDSQGALDSYRGWILSNHAYILDANDKQLENVGYQTYGAGDNGVGVSYMFQLNGDLDSYRLIYESPSSIQRQTIKYELKDIPLP
ncbi:MAG: hypothetical protein U0930_22655 [Pirellulales bacterium]